MEGMRGRCLLVEWDAGGLELNQKIGCFVRFACSGRFRKVVVFEFVVAFLVAQQPATFSDCVQGVSQWWYFLLRLFRACLKGCGFDVFICLVVFTIGLPCVLRVFGLLY